jgi:atypical dual specificity phosphatase
LLLYWIDKERFGGASQPQLSDLPYLKSIELAGIICLQEESTSEELAQLLDVAYLHRPIPDFGIPSSEDLPKIISFLIQQQKIRPKIPVLIHCTAGNGRTGTILASLVKILDQMESNAAITNIRTINPLAIETEEQEDFIKNLAKPSFPQLN